MAVEAKQHMITLGQPIDVAPAQALIGMLRASAGHSMWLGQRVAELDEDGLGDLRAEALVRLYSEERDRCARVAKACLDSGVDNGMVKLAEETTQAVMRAVYVAAVEVGMTRDQARRFGPAFQRALTTAEA